MKTLKLDRNYKPLDFISLHKLGNFIANDKVEILAVWKGVSFYGDQEYPAIVQLKKYTRTKLLKKSFSLKGVFKRDLYVCQYTGQALLPDQLTVDHILPKSRGGQSTWLNCVTASREINLKKGNRTPEEAGLKLIKQPFNPRDYVAIEYAALSEVHPDWEPYFPDVKWKKKSFPVSINRITLW